MRRDWPLAMVAGCSARRCDGVRRRASICAVALRDGLPAAQLQTSASGAARFFRARGRMWSTAASFCLIYRAMRYTAASQIARQSLGLLAC